MPLTSQTIVFTSIWTVSMHHNVLQ